MLLYSKCALLAILVSRGKPRGVFRGVCMDAVFAQALTGFELPPSTVHLGSQSAVLAEQR